MHYSFPPEVDLAVKSLAIFRSWKDYVGRDGDFRQTGFVRIVPESELPRLEKNVAMQCAHGVDASVVTRAELAALVPDWDVDDVPLAAWEPGSGYGDGAGVANDFLERAREMGVSYRSQTRATGFLTAGGRVTGVSTDRGDVAAPDRHRRDRPVEPPALCRRRLRPSGGGRVPRGGDPEEPGGIPRRGARPASTASRRRTSAPRSAA